MLRRWRSDVEIVPLRGNVDTRLRKCREGAVDAIVLAMAGLKRLGLSDQASQVFGPDRCLPAVGQGALAVEYRADDHATAAILARLAHPETTVCVSSERGVLVAAEGSCQIPIAAYAERRGDTLLLRAMLAEPDGSNPRFGQSDAPWPDEAATAFELGRKLGAELNRG
jgi:hydroxymethylbilane synthase